MKNNFLKIFVFSILIFSLFSCATRQKYVEQQKAWIGQSFTDYMKEFGYPNSSMDVSPSPDVKTYVYQRTAVNPNTPMLRGNPVQTLMVAQNNPQFVQLGALKCTTWVSVNEKTQIIKNITFRGNYCVTRN
ncbi:hypothetical protein FLM55_00990 [Francisella sp. Scap27]|uniref:hypothetical protein n=1 Tax=Francisella sp. Scap27 TaxID=2589986 RepID=UPI0015C05938|nr:hypothetical protein [Francisella sp. Scap27]QLE78387.1 hypothetical protein FLM55_00990 [Francisella sp. Scap27]